MNSTTSINSDNIPEWSLSSVFSSIDSKEYTEYLDICRQKLSNVDSLLKTADDYTKNNNDHFDFISWLAAFLAEYEKTTEHIRTICAYAYLLYSTDTTNSSYLNNLNDMQDFANKNILQMQKFSLILASHKKYLEEFFKTYPNYKEHELFLCELIEQTAHVMSSAEEKLAADLQKTGGDAWSRLQEQLISNLKDERGNTFNQIRNEAYSTDKNVRKAAWEKEIQLLKANEIAFAACLSNLKGETILLNQNRHWASPLEKSAFTARVSTKTLAALINAIEKSLPDWQNYFKAKAKILRATNSTASSSKSGLAFYDLFAPILTESQNKESLLEKKWTFEEAKNYIVEEFSSFSEDMGNFAKYAFEHNWIDAKIKQGKVGGAYDEDIPKGHQSRILSNYTGTFSDIITLAHELGHAYHFSCLKGKSPIFFDYPMTLAESASTFAETIVKQNMLRTCSEDDRIKLVELDLQDAGQVLIDILSRFYFEKSVFEERAKGELNAQDFCRLMEQAQEKTYGAGLSEERHPYIWAVKSHYYITSFDFYNYPYAFGQLFAAGLFKRYTREGSSFAKIYAHLLSQTGNTSCENLCKQAGFDITQSEFWEDGIDLYKKEIEEFVAYADSLKD